jgi:hypothetical protein
MTRTWLKRILRLESIRQTCGGPPVFRYGSVKRLLKDPPGDREVVVSISKRIVLSNVERSGDVDEQGI